MTPSGGPGDDHPWGTRTPVRRTPAGRRRRVVRAVVVALLGLLVAAALTAALVWRAGGGASQVVATPSMGTAAPVGTLVLTRPTAAVAVGDVVTYHPPVPNHPRTVTHRVVSVAPDGGFRTRGDINGAEDPWTVRPSDLVGVATTILPGVGWLVKALPILLVGSVLVWFVSRWLLPWRWGLPLRVLGYSLVVSAAVTMLKPFVGAVVLGTSADPAGTRVLLASTGLLPIRATAQTGGHVDLLDGQVGTITTQLPPGAKGAVVTTGVHMSVWLWILMTLVWMIPMFYGLVAAWRRPIEDDDTEDDGPADDDPGSPEDGLVSAPTERLPAVTRVEPVSGSGRHRAVAGSRPPSWLAVPLVAALAGTITFHAASTTATFTATVTNSVNTAASATFFTCASALSTIAPAYLAWPLDDVTVTPGSTARDVSGNSRTGTYVNGFTTSTSKPCARDTNRSVTLAPTALLRSSVATSNILPIRSTNTFSTAIWIRTTTATGGRFMGWGSTQSLESPTYDRHLYMTNGGQIVFGVFPGAYRTVTSPRSYNDGNWHLVVATLSGAGMVLYVDGVQVGADPGTVSAEGDANNLGFWRVGWDNLNTWPNRPTTDYWTGGVADAAVYTSALSAAQVAQLYGAAS